MLWEELTAPEFSRGVRKAKGVCVLSVGVIEKHGEHLPLGTDFLIGRALAIEAARREPAVVFPPYLFGQIHEARHQPGAVAVSGDTMMRLLSDVCGEISRNGLKKIILLNPHGGNTYFLNYFCQLALERELDYSIYLPGGSQRRRNPKIKRLFKDPYDGHAGESETSMILAVHPELARTRADIPSRGKPQRGLSHLPNVGNGFSWYGTYPHHYSGIARLATKAKGKILMEEEIDYVTRVIRAVKRDTVAGRLARAFYRRSRKPVSH